MDRMPAGEYYVGDLCYVMHSEWDEFCSTLEPGKHRLGDGREYWWSHTKYGDGGYPDDEGREYGVDAGLIGVIKVSDIGLHCSENFLRGGHIIKFDHDFDCWYDNATGEIHIGDLTIYTDGNPFDEDESDWYNEEEENGY